MNKIHYSPKSQRDLDEIYDYIKYKLCSPIAAKNTVSGILDKIEYLKSHSDIGNIWYLENDVKWVDDGLRKNGSDDERNKGKKILAELLEKHNIDGKVKMISGNYEERLNKALKIIKGEFHDI